MFLVIMTCLFSPILVFSLPIGAIVTYLVNDNTDLTPEYIEFDSDKEKNLLLQFNYYVPFYYGLAWEAFFLIYPIGIQEDNEYI